ncbi:hypothetical protein HG535_0F02280 [Zygotorulaspora mrakii]|uniref:Prokaryotic-type class I peptide chain release factors domain-containing protein n=1 Tax=Zygotorulaspora mrakii TaxID=42260 RepID=A0A7H9B5B7_ZYGMR|nr:uncharacterized protein HG535_0F02280 [Zygotorulaspora mrakii]QLG73717.1 hypothetical protein HG535_0F02280 [Zygotorulaspora mrakii]
MWHTKGIERFVQFVRFSSSNGARKVAIQWLKYLSVDTVPLKLFTIRYDRSSGPGGQNVNKVNSKCTLTLSNFSKCSWLPNEVRQQLIEKPVRYYAKRSDSLVVQSDETRSRDANKHVCLMKLVTEIRNSCWFPGEIDQTTVKKWENIKKNADRKRIRQKKISSEKKKLRSKLDF